MFHFEPCMSLLCHFLSHIAFKVTPRMQICDYFAQLSSISLAKLSQIYRLRRQRGARCTSIDLSMVRIIWNSVDRIRGRLSREDGRCRMRNDIWFLQRQTGDPRTQFSDCMCYISTFICILGNP